MIRMEPFSFVHALNISDYKGEDFIKTMKDHEKDASAYTVYYDNDILCCGGIMVLWEGVGEVWTVNGPLIHKHPFTFHKFMLKWMGIFFKKHNLRRLQATIDAECKDHIKWVESLGFINETPCGMKNFYGDKTFYLYARCL